MYEASPVGVAFQGIQEFVFVPRRWTHRDAKSRRSIENAVFRSYYLVDGYLGSYLDSDLFLSVPPEKDETMENAILPPRTSSSVSQSLNRKRPHPSSSAEVHTARKRQDEEAGSSLVFEDTLLGVFSE